MGAAACWGSILPAVQNPMLAGRARGLGTTLTTLHRAAEGESETILEIPPDVATIALIPLGCPAAWFGRPRRRPSEGVIHWDRWGRRGPDSR